MRNMRQRCLNPRHPHWSYYGGRGITICRRWDSFQNFLTDMGDRPEGLTLDRIDNNGPYNPENCRWATKAQQQHNTRRTKLTQDAVDWMRSRPRGVTQKQMAERLGISPPRVSVILSGKEW